MTKWRGGSGVFDLVTFMRRYMGNTFGLCTSLPALLSFLPLRTQVSSNERVARHDVKLCSTFARDVYSKSRRADQGTSSRIRVGRSLRGVAFYII